MACDNHHDMYDGQRLGSRTERLAAEPLTERGFDGPVRWMQGETVYEEEER